MCACSPLFLSTPRKVALEIFDMCRNYNIGRCSTGCSVCVYVRCVCVCVYEVCVQFVSDALNFELCLYVVHGTARQLAVIVIGINMLQHEQSEQ